jgi:predicted ATPase
MAELPTGTVTFLFTDIEGSTRLLQELGDRYADALAEHRRVLREAFARHGGIEVDTQGDAFFVAFERAGDALAGAQEAQAALADGPVRVRMGIHTGKSGVTDEGYVGLEVHRAARIAAAAHGGQTVLSRATRELVDGEVIDLGEHRLKDFEDPVWLFQVGGVSFPPLRTLANTNLPRPASFFVGRARELAELAELLRADARLLTLTGPGGSGKTRLAIEAAAELVGDYPNGVFWVPLAPLRDPALVLETVAQAVGAKEELASHFAGKRALLVLDNFEQVIGAAPALSQLLRSCPELEAVVTSRELLRVDGEREYAVPPLADSEAVELFCARSGLDRDGTVAELCRRLDSLPLAVELAAARTSVLSPAQILERLSERLELLRGGRDADTRHATLRATIEWSYDLLEPHEKLLFARLAVFAGGCTLQAAEEVCEADVDTLQSLVERSLVRRTGERFWMLETIREYALGRLAADGELSTARRSYSSWILRLAEEAGAGLESPDQDAWIDRVHEEHDNVRDGFSLALEADNGEFVLRTAAALSRYFWIRPGEALRWLERGLARREGVPNSVVAEALRAAGETAWFVGDSALALERFREALALLQELGDEGGTARLLTRLGPPLEAGGRLDEAVALLEQAAALHRRLGQRHELALTVGLLAGMALKQGDCRTAADLFASALALARELGDSMLMANSLVNLAETALQADELAQAEGFVREALKGAWVMRDLIGVMYCFATFAWLARAQGDSRRAALIWGAAERLDAKLGDTMWRNERAEYELRVGAEVLGDADGRAEGRALETEQAVELALGT